MKCKHLLIMILATALTVNLCGCSSKTPPDLTSEMETEKVSGKNPDATFSDSQLNFSLELFKQASAESTDQNILISPLSVQLALAMTANGADGVTKTEMESVIGDNLTIDSLNEYLYQYVKDLPSGKNGKLEIANSIWLKDNDASLNVKEDFLQTTTNYYDAEVYKEIFDKETLNKINNWVKSNTDGMIDKIIDEINSDTIMYLINALVFDAEWMEPYKKDDISDGTFTSTAGDKRSVEMMTSSEYQYIVNADSVGFIKDYADSNYKFVALLPNENIDIYEYINSLTVEKLSSNFDNIQTETVVATMPKFSYDYSIFMNNILKQMGMPTAFDGNNADFSKIAESSTGNIFISDVLHKTYISVDELGTKAGAVTKIEMSKNSMAPSRITITLDRPFVYMIVDGENNLPVFMGAVFDIQ